MNTIIATLQIMDDSGKEGEPFTKEFEDDYSMYTYLRSQNGHPFPSIRMITFERI